MMMLMSWLQDGFYQAEIEKKNASHGSVWLGYLNKSKSSIDVLSEFFSFSFYFLTFRY